MSKATHTGGPSPQGLVNLLSDATPAWATNKATHTGGPSPQGLANLLSDATPAGATSKATHTGGPSLQGLANLLSDATPAGATTEMHIWWSHYISQAATHPQRFKNEIQTDLAHESGGVGAINNTGGAAPRKCRCGRAGLTGCR